MYSPLLILFTQVGVLEVPGDRDVQPVFEIMPLCPPEVTLDLVAVDRVATVMTRPVAYKGDEITIIGIFSPTCWLSFMG